MKKFSFLLVALFAAMGAFAQCITDTSVLLNSPGGFYPDAAHLPAVVQDSAYNQTVTGKIQDTMSMTFNIPGVPIPITVSITVDSVRLDSIQGLPSGINWSKSSNTLPGGGYGCVQFTGTTTDSAGRYTTNAIGMIWAHLYVPGFVNVDTFSYGSLQRLPAYRNFYLVVDSTEQALAATANARTICGAITGGTATVFPTGGSPTDPYSYLWSNGATTYSISPVDSGTYWVTVTSGTDTIVDSVTVVADPTPIAITVTADSGSVHTTGMATIAVNGGVPPYTYRWNNGDTTATISNLPPGTYRVTVRDSLGCRQTDSVVIANLAAGVNNISSPQASVSLFPNPTNSSLNIVVQSPVAMSAKIEVIDITGKVVYSTSAGIGTGKYTQTIDVKQFSPGLYILQLTSDTQSIHERFVVTR
jgi:hypothetical protein